MAGQLTANSVQLGDSATATQNFTLRTNADGTATLARGNVGAASQDVLTVDASGVVALPANTTTKLVAASGSAPTYACRAWAVFNGTTTGTNAPTSGGNVTSVTRNSAGDYTITMTTAMPDANYAVALSCGAGTTGGYYTTNAAAATPTTTVFRVVTASTTGTPTDALYVYVSVFK